MAVKTMNIEIGDRLTKVCQSIPKGKSYQIKSSFMFQTPEGSVSDGVITAPDIFAAKLREQMGLHGLQDAKNAVFSLTSGKVATREVKLPPVKDNRIKGVVEQNASEYFPVDMSLYHVSYKLLERIAKGEEAGARVLVFAVPLSLLDTYFKMAGLAGLVVQAIDFSGNSQYQALRSLTAEGVTMYVNVDCNSSFVSFLQEGRLIMQRAFTFGGDELVLGYMNAVGKGPEAYVDALQECSRPEAEFLQGGVLSAEEVAESLGRLVSSIVRSSDYFNSNHWEVQVERVVLMGPCGHLAGLKDLIASGTGLETAYLDDLPGAAAFANAVDSASFYISCIGSAIAPVDLIPAQFKASKKKRRGLREKNDEHAVRDGAVICAVCLAAALGLSLSALLGYYGARQDKAALEQKIAALEYTREIHDSYVLHQAGADALLALDAAIDSPNDGLTAFIAELEEKMPAEIIVLSATCTQETVSLNVTVPSYNEAAVVLVQLRNFQSLADVAVSSVTENADEPGLSSVSFSVTCTYGPNPYFPAETDEG